MLTRLASRLMLWGCLSGLFVFLHLSPPTAWQQLSFFIQDMMTRHWVTPLPADSPLVLVDIDEASIDLIGAWPWSRSLLAQLLVRLKQDYQVAAIGLDIVFPESRAAEEDAQLAQVVAQTEAILAVAFDYVGQSPPLAMGAMGDGIAAVDMGFAYPAFGFIGSYPQLASASLSGHISPVTDSQGLLRYMPPFVRWQDHVYPSLALALLAQWRGQSLIPVVQQQMLFPWSHRQIGLLLENGQEQAGLWTIPYRYDLASFAMIPAWQVLSDRVDKERLAGKVVILGSSALGLSDRFATPLAPITPGMLVHAQMFSSLAASVATGATAEPMLSQQYLLLLMGLLLVLLSATLMRHGLKYALLLLLISLMAGLIWLQYAYQAGAPLLDVGEVMLFVLLWFVAHSALEWSLTRQQNERLYRLFRDYLPPHLLHQVVQQSAESVLQPKQGSVTILFADIAGFTQMTENMSTEEVVQLTRRVLSLLTQAVYEQGGTLDKYMGDALMAFWNAPVPQPQHRRLAIQAGLSMRHALQSLNDVRHALGLAPIRVRIGINTGDVLVGDLGTEWRHAYTVMGDAVNVAQRLTEVADALASDMVIGANTAATLAAIIPDLQPKGEVVLSGKHQPVSVFVIPVTKLDRYLRQNVA